MLRRLSRSRLLVVFAAANLVFWAAVAVAVAVIASDVVDLGFEAAARSYQATVVSSLAEGSAATPSPGGAVSTPISSLAGSPLPQDGTAQAGSTSLPQAAQATPPAAPGKPSLSAQTSSQAVAAAPLPPQTTPQAPAASGSQAAAAPINRPLLLADPSFTDLAALNSELGRSASGRPVQIRYQEAALNREIGALPLNNPDLPFRDVYVDLKRDQAVVTAQVTVLGFRVKALARGKIVARDCLPQAEIESVSVAGVFTPSFVRDAVGQMIQEAMAWYPADYPLCLDQIVLEDDRATIYGYRR